ncbi:MAG: GAF domain-containing protein [Anaerolineae bacterium]|nr:GAF domain-containing protein [Anaerolineae bacterium]
MVYLTARQQSEQALPQAMQSSAIPVNLVPVRDAVIVAREGGQVLFVNDTARQWFDSSGDDLSLWIMAQQAQPADTFWELFAAPGRATFSLDHRQVEATSHEVYTRNGRQFIVVLRDRAGSRVERDRDPAHAMTVISDISKTISASLNLSETLNAVLTNVGRIVEYSVGEACLWDPERQTLQRRASSGDYDFLELLEAAGREYRIDEGYSGWIARYRQPLLIGEVAARTDVQPFLNDPGAPFQSFIGVPLTVGEKFIGTLEFISRDYNAFDHDDLFLLQVVAGQAAIAIENARLYEAQSARLTELTGLQQITQALGALTDSHQLYAQLTERIARQMDVTMCGVLLYDHHTNALVAQAPFYGVSPAVLDLYRIPLTPGTPARAIWDKNMWWRSNDVPNDTLVRDLDLLKLATVVGVKTTAIAVMTVGDRRIGLLQAANKRDGSNFSDEDTAMLTIFAAQAAIVVENARLFQREQRRAEELSGLQQIGQAISAMQDPGELYSQINARIAELMGVEMCGILHYDEVQQALVSRLPFYGVSDQFASQYAIPMAEGSPAYQLFFNVSTWITNDAQHDPLAQALGLVEIAKKIGVKQTLLAALMVGGRRLGIVQASNKLGGGEFTEADARILSIYASQAAIIIDNTRLFRQTQEYADSVEGLQRIARIAGSALSRDEMFGRVMAEAVALLKAEKGLVLAFDPRRRVLRAEPGSVCGVSVEEARYLQIHLSEAELPHSPVSTLKPLVVNDLTQGAHLYTAYQELIELFDIRNLLIVPFIVQDRGAGEVLVANKTEGAFASADVRLLNTIVSQLAGAIERAGRFETTDEELKHRLEELDALAKISRELNSTLESDRVLAVIRSEALRATGADSATVVLLKPSDEWNAPDDPAIDRRLGGGEALNGLAPIERRVAVTGEGCLVQDYAEGDPAPAPPHAESAVCVPIIYAGRVAGLVHLWSGTPYSFDHGTQEFLHALADQAAVAVANAERYQDQLERNNLLRQRAEQLSQIYNLSRILRGEKSLEEILEAVAFGIQETSDFNTVLISLADADGKHFYRAAGAGIPIYKLEEMKNSPVPAERIKALMVPEYQISASYLLPGDRVEQAGIEVYVPVKQATGTSARHWLPDDSLLIPLRTTAGAMIGYMTVDDPRSGLRPTRDDIQTLEIFANQAAFAVETAHVYRQMADRADELTRSLAEARENYEKLQDASETLRHKDEEISKVNQLLETRASRLLAVHRITQVAVQAGGEGLTILQPVTGAVVDGMDVDLCGIALTGDADMPQLAALSGILPANVTPDVLLHPDGLLAQTLQTGKQVMVDEVSTSPWANIEPVVSLGLRTLVTVPILVSGETSGALICGSRQPWLSYGREDLDLFHILADQIGHLYTNAHLLEVVHQEAEAARRERDRLQALHEVANRVQRSRSMPERLQIIANGIQVTGWNKVQITLRGERMERSALITAGYTDAEMATLREAATPPEVWQRRFADKAFETLRVGEGYYLRYNYPWVVENVWDGEVPAPAWVEDALWHPADSVLMPLYGARRQIIGLIEMGEPLDGLRPTAESLQPIELFANQAASIIETTRLYMESVRTADEEALLSEIMEAVTARLEVVEITRSLARGLRVLVPYTLVELALLDNTYTHFDVIRVRDGDNGDLILEHGSALPIDGTAVSQAVEDQETHIFYLNQGFPDELSDLSQLWEAGIQTLMITPLSVGGRAVGTINLASAIPETLGYEDHRFLIRRMANIAAVALQNARLFQQVMDSEDFSSALSRLGIDLNMALDLDEVIEIVCRESPQILGVDDSFMWLVDGDELVGATSCGPYAEEFVGARQSLSDPDALGPRVIRERRPIAIDHALEHSAPHDLARRFDLEAVLGVPLMREERALGVLILGHYTNPDRFGPTDEERASIFSVQVAISIQNARLMENERERAVQLEALTLVSGELTALLDREAIINAMLDQLARVVPFDSVALWLKQGEQLTIEAVRGYAEEEHLLGLQVDADSSVLFKDIAGRRDVINVPDVTKDPARFPAAEVRMVRSWLGAPILDQGEAVGLLALEKNEVNFYQLHHQQLALAFANQVAVALRNARLFAEAGQRADQLDRHAQRLAQLNRLSQRLAQTLDVSSALKAALDELVPTLGVTQAKGIVFDEMDRGRLYAEYPPRFIMDPPVVELEGHAVIEHVRESDSPVTIDDIQDDPFGASVCQITGVDEAKSAMIVPMSIASRVTGLLFLIATEAPRYFPAEYIELARIIANQTALVVQSASSYEQVAQRTQELEMLFESAAIMSSVLDLDQVTNLVAQQIFRALGGDSCTIYFWDDIHQRIEVSAHLDMRPEERARPLEAGTLFDLSDYPMFARTLADGQPFVLYRDDEDADPVEREHLERLGIYGRITLPLEGREGPLGLIEAQTTDPNHQFRQSAIKVARMLASQGGVAIYNARLQAETQATAERQFALQNISQRLASVSTNLDVLYKVLKANLPAVLGAKSLYLALYDRDAQQVTYPLALREGSDIDMPAHPLDSDVTSWIIRNRSEKLLVGDIRQVTHSQGISVWDDGTVAYCGVPVETRDRVYGVLAVRDFRDSYAFNYYPDVQMLQSVAGQVGVTLEKAELLTNLGHLVEERTQELQTEMAKSRSILEGVADGVMFADGEGKIMVFNEAAERILDLKRKDIIGLPIRQLAGVFGGAASRWFDAIERWAESPTTYQPGTPLEERLQIEKRHVSVHLSPVTMEGEFLGVVSVIRDITRDVEVDRLKSEFVSTVSHELRTPMTSIKGYADLMMMGAAGPMSDGQKKFLGTIKSNADRLSVLVNDLLEISRMDQKRVSLNLGPVLVRNVVEDAMRHLRGRTENEGKQMTFERQVPDDIPLVYADPARVTQILTNLVDNAFSYTPEGGTVTVTVVQAGDYVKFSVIDTGIGISRQDLPRVFERFYRGEDPLVYETSGTGLGLAIVKELVEMHGGRIDAESELGEGSTFWFTLPLYREGETELKPDSASGVAEAR